MQDGTPSNALGGIDEQTVADTALVVEALAAFAGSPDDLSMTPSEVLCIDAHQPRTP